MARSAARGDGRRDTEAGPQHPARAPGPEGGEPGSAMPQGDGMDPGPTPHRGKAHMALPVTSVTSIAEMTGDTKKRCGSSVSPVSPVSPVCTYIRVTYLPRRRVGLYRK